MANVPMATSGAKLLAACSHVAFHPSLVIFIHPGTPPLNPAALGRQNG